MRLSGCVESLFLREHGDVASRMRACAAAGLEAVEFWLWRDKDLGAIERALGDTGLALSGFCVEPRLPIVDPQTHRDWVAGVRESLAVAQRLGAPALLATGVGAVLMLGFTRALGRRWAGARRKACMSRRC